MFGIPIMPAGMPITGAELTPIMPGRTPAIIAVGLPTVPGCIPIMPVLPVAVLTGCCCVGSKQQQTQYIDYTAITINHMAQASSQGLLADHWEPPATSGKP